jgi:twitching motility two-component system response regulator PilH
MDAPVATNAAKRRQCGKINAFMRIPHPVAVVHGMSRLDYSTCALPDRQGVFLAFFKDIKRRFSSLLGTDAGRTGVATPAPWATGASRTAEEPMVMSDDDHVFDPGEAADAPFVDTTADDLAGLDPTALDPTVLDPAAMDPAADDPDVVEPYPNDRRLKQRRNARAGTRVLLVDDSPTIVALLRKLLRQNGYETLDAGDAETGIELARSEQPDLIFLDIVLPGMNGFAALRALRRDPLTKAIPIIMISGNVAATEQFYVQRIGADDFMKKPFSRAEVFSRIEVLLDAASVPRRAAERDPMPDMPPPHDATES